MQKDSRHHEQDDEEWTPPSPPVSQDGGIAPGYGLIGKPPSLPPRTADHFVCLRGPCRHYWHLVTSANLGNPAGTFEALGIEEPREHHHVCLVNPGFETSFADDNAYECSKWDPMPDVEIQRLTASREAYYQRHPEHRSKGNTNDDDSSGSSSRVHASEEETSDESAS